MGLVRQLVSLFDTADLDEKIDITDIVGKFYCETQNAEEKKEAQDFLEQLLKDKDYHLKFLAFLYFMIGRPNLDDAVFLKRKLDDFEKEQENEQIVFAVRQAMEGLLEKKKKRKADYILNGYQVLDSPICYYDS